MKRKDLIVRFKTDTGKTFCIPAETLFGRLNIGAREMQALVLLPTHELAIQILRQIERLSQNSQVKSTSAPIAG